MLFKKQILNHKLNFLGPLQKGGIYLLSVVVIFVSIGLLTTIKPAYRFSSQVITDWTNQIDSSTFLYLFDMENRSYKQAYPENKVHPRLSTILFQMATNIKPNDLRSILGHEIPGLPRYGRQMVITGENTDYMELSIESSPPLEDVLKDRKAVVDEKEKDGTSDETEKDSIKPSQTNDKEIVYIYNTHSRESFLPHLPDVTDPNSAHHSEVNIMKVSDYFSESLESQGIGTYVDKTDHMTTLNENGWGYGQSYRASRDAVVEAVATNKDIKYIFDLHRDSLPREKTTIEIDGESYAQVLMVIGAEYDGFDKNLSFATELHYLIEEKFPGLSKNVIQKQGPGTNGVYNQDLSENAILIEMGGYDNTLEELYRTADVLAEVFSEFYWDAEKVDVQ